MNAIYTAILVFGVCCALGANARSIPSGEESHSISKRSPSADHSITDAKSRHLAKTQRQLLLLKLLRHVDTSASELPEEVKKSQGTTLNTLRGRPKGQRRRGGRGRKGAKANRRQIRSLRKSVEVLLESEYADQILDAITKIVPASAKDVKNAAARVSKFARKCKCADNS